MEILIFVRRLYARRSSKLSLPFGATVVIDDLLIPFKLIDDFSITASIKEQRCVDDCVQRVV